MAIITRELIARLKDTRPADWLRCDALVDTPNPCSRKQFEPGHFTASAFVLHPSEPSILLIKHRKLGLWLQPGGHIQPDDDSAEHAARRELEEETGLEAYTSLFDHCPFDLDVHQIPARPDEPEHAHFDLRFAYQAQSTALKAQEDEVSDVAWTPIAALDDIHTDDSVRQSAELLSTLLRRES